MSIAAVRSWSIIAKPALFFSALSISLFVMPGTASAESMAMCSELVKPGKAGKYEYKRETGVSAYIIYKALDAKWRAETGGFSYYCQYINNAKRSEQAYFMLARITKPPVHKAFPNAPQKYVMLHTGASRAEALESMKRGLFSQNWQTAPDSGWFEVIGEGFFNNSSQ